MIGITLQDTSVVTSIFFAEIFTIAVCYFSIYKMRSNKENLEFLKKSSRYVIMYMALLVLYLILVELYVSFHEVFGYEWAMIAFLLLVVAGLGLYIDYATLMKVGT